MKKPAFLSAALLLAATALFGHGEPSGAPLDEKTEKLVRAQLPLCEGMKLTGENFDQKMPQGLTARVIRAASENHACDGQYMLVTSNGGTFYLGYPWFIAEAGGPTIEEKLQNFAWRSMQSSIVATIDRKRSPEGLFRASLMQTTVAPPGIVRGPAMRIMTVATSSPRMSRWTRSVWQ